MMMILLLLLAAPRNTYLDFTFAISIIRVRGWGVPDVKPLAGTIGRQDGRVPLMCAIKSRVSHSAYITLTETTSRLFSPHNFQGAKLNTGLRFTLQLRLHSRLSLLLLRHDVSFDVRSFLGRVHWEW